jgi:hypothetical protein
MKGYETMSQWTHILGIVRVYKEPAISLSSVIGPTNLWDEDNFETCSLPTGTEGSIDYFISKHPKYEHEAMITFFGDLRDFGMRDLAGVQKWWFELLPKLGCIRDAVLSVNIEGLAQLTYGEINQ